MAVSPPSVIGGWLSLEESGVTIRWERTLHPAVVDRLGIMVVPVYSPRVYHVNALLSVSLCFSKERAWWRRVLSGRVRLSASPI